MCNKVPRTISRQPSWTDSRNAYRSAGDRFRSSHADRVVTHLTQRHLLRLEWTTQFDRQREPAPAHNLLSAVAQDPEKLAKTRRPALPERAGAGRPPGLRTRASAAPPPKRQVWLPLPLSGKLDELSQRQHRKASELMRGRRGIH